MGLKVKSIGLSLRMGNRARRERTRIDEYISFVSSAQKREGGMNSHW